MHQLSPYVSLVGAGLMVVGVVLHVVSLATPHLAGADVTAMADKLKAAMETRIPPGTDPDTRQEIEEAFQDRLEDAGLTTQGDLKYGLWEMCFNFKGSGMGICGNWASDTTVGSDRAVHSFKVPAWIQGSQAMAILGLLVAVGAGVLAAVHIFVPSKGDRLRLLPIYIGMACLLAGAIVLCEDIIVGVKYNTVADTAVDPNSDQEPPADMVAVMESLFFLSWGFVIDVVAAAFFLLSGLFFILAGRASSEGSGLV